jgi:hypothetical protein
MRARLFLALLASWVPHAWAQTPLPAEAARAEAQAVLRVYHVPPASAENRVSGFPIRATIENLWLAKEVILYYRRPNEPRYRRTEFRKGQTGPEFIALVPEATLSAPGFEYYLETTLKDGTKVANFGSAASPQRVVVRDLSAEERRALRLARHLDTQHDFSIAFKYLNAGVKVLNLERGGTGEFRDSYNQLDLNYRHRILSDYIYQIAFSFGILGAKLGMSRPVADSRDDPSLRTGVYFGRATATWELASLVGLDASVVLGANQAGFVVGGGGTLRLGRLSGTHLDVGVEYIQDTGYDAWLEFAWDTVPRLMMSLRADLTTYPSNNDGLAVFPSFNVKWAVTRNVYAGAFLGYGTRFQYQRGGVSGGASFGYQF